MRGSIQKLTLAGQEISLYLPPKALRNTPCRLLLAADGELLFEILTSWRIRWKPGWQRRTGV